MPTDTQVIDATLKAACIRAAAIAYAGSRELMPSAREIVAFARELYIEATSVHWERGDPREPVAPAAIR